ncbi:hypothetical protein BH24DEI1_BH24DEI1_16990 [soil metagenome]
MSSSHLRLADLLAALSLVLDLGMGMPKEEAMRSCLLATRLARLMSLAEETVRDVYYTALLKFVGCTAYAHEEAALFGGDDIALRNGGAKVDFGNPREAMPFLLFEPGRHAPPLRRVLIVARAVAQGSQFDRQMAASHCDVAVLIAKRLGLGAGVQEALNQTFEHWDGQGAPHKLKGEAIALPLRVTQVAFKAVLFEMVGGFEAARDAVWRLAGGALDPEVAAVFLRHGPKLLEEIAAVDACQAVVEAEPQPHRWISEVRLDEVAHAFADMVDLKVPFLRGHASGVAVFAEAAACTCGLSAPDMTTLRRAALLHDLGLFGLL